MVCNLNTTNLAQVDGGYLIKQGDVASTFGFVLIAIIERKKHMQQISEIIANGAVSITIILLAIAVKTFKDYLIKEGGEKTVKIAEILAKNAVHAVEQVAQETGYKGDEKLEQARDKVRAELTKYNISMTDKDLDTFVESAVKQMNDAWKGQE